MSSIVIEIRAGAGGDDSKLFIHDLASAYIKYAGRSGLSAEMISESASQLTLQIDGKNALNKFKWESGSHCVQRIPPTERNGRAHTSMVTVAVFPITDATVAGVRDQDIEIIAQRGGGPGGQNVNKVNSAIRATHIPTGMQVFINGRDQLTNKRRAIQILKSRLIAIQEDKMKKDADDNRFSQIEYGGRGNKVRTYNFKDSRVVDHRLGTMTNNIKQIMKGCLELILERS